MEAARILLANWKQRLMRRESFMAIAASLAVGAAAAAAWRQVEVLPERAIIQKRYQSTLDILKLYGLQLSYKKATGAYANDLPSLLAIDPGGAALKARLAANVNMSTLVVAGSAKKFKIELNVLDPGRTLLKIKGPPPPNARSAPALPAQAVTVDADGAPIGR